PVRMANRIAVRLKRNCRQHTVCMQLFQVDQHNFRLNSRCNSESLVLWLLYQQDNQRKSVKTHSMQIVLQTTVSELAFHLTNANLERREYKTIDHSLHSQCRQHKLETSR